MSEKKAKQDRVLSEHQYLRASTEVKDRLILELVTVCTAQRFRIPPHVIKIVEALYPGKLAILKQIDEVLENEQKRIENEIGNEKEVIVEKKRPKLKLVAADYEKPKIKSSRRKSKA